MKLTLVVIVISHLGQNHQYLHRVRVNGGPDAVEVYVFSPSSRVGGRGIATGMGVGLRGFLVKFYDILGFRTFGLRTPSFTPPGFRPSGFVGLRSFGLRKIGLRICRPPSFRSPGFRPPGFRSPGFRPFGFRTIGFRPPGFKTLSFGASGFRDTMF